MTIDLRTCQAGQLVELRNGDIVRYGHRSRDEDARYPHIVGDKSYTDDGHYYSCREEDDDDVVNIFPQMFPLGKSKSPKPDKHPSVAAWESFPWITDRVPTKEDSRQQEFQYSVLTLANGMIYVYDCEHIKLGAKWMHLPGWAPPKLTPQEEALALLEGKDDNWVPSAEEWLVFRKAIKP